MSKFFVISTDPLDAPQEQQLVELAKQFSWWHWLPNFWLLKDHSEVWTVSALRDRFTAIAPNSRCIILQVDPIAWDGRVKPDAKGNRMEDWLFSYWKRP
jgi:hypothetical protein